MIHRGIGYDVRGEGPAVLLLHPFPFDRTFFANLSLQGFRLVSVDARGFGESELRGDFSIDDLADDALCILDHLGVPMAAALGSSMGGYVALSIAARHPQRLSALILADSRAGADGEAARNNRAAAAREVRDVGPASFLDGVAVRLCGRASSAEVRARVQASAGSSSGDFARALPAMLLALRDRPDRTAILGKLHLPALIIVGAEDTVTPPDEARAMKREIPGAELVAIAGAGHLPSVEVAAEFARVVTEFLEANLTGA